jgi:hypothetical protein
VIRGSVPKLRHVQPQNPSGRVVPLPRPVPTISVRQLRPASAANYTEEAYLFRSAPGSKHASGRVSAIMQAIRIFLRESRKPAPRVIVAETSLTNCDDSVPIKHFVPLRLVRFQLLAGVCSSLFLHSPKLLFAGGLCWYISFADCHCSVTDQTQGTRRHAEFH